MTKTLPERLRERLITIPKPGAKPFDPPPGWSHTMTVGGERKAGDDAGYMSINANMSGAAGLGQSTFKMQAMVYAVDPLCEEAAVEIERLEGIEKAAARAMGLWDADEVNAGIQAFKDLKQELDDEPRSAPLATGGYFIPGPAYLVGELSSEQTVKTLAPSAPPAAGNADLCPKSLGGEGRHVVSETENGVSEVCLNCGAPVTP